MLTDLYIKNFAIIDNLHASFQRGLNILTGETGAGKSIIIDAVNLVLGGRASADLIRSGEEEATVEAIFDLTGHPELASLLAQMGIDGDGELLVKRTIARSGKNRVFLNGGLSTLAVLAEVARRLINIYGQHESQTLLKPENHLYLLDGCGALEPVRLAYGTLYEQYRALREQLAALVTGEMEAAQRLDLLTFQSEEMASATLRPGEDEDLLQERHLLAHAEKLLLRSQAAYDLLYGGEVTILGRLGEAIAAVREMEAIDPAVAPMEESLQSACAQLEDVALSLRAYAGRVEADPERLQTVDDRLDLLNRLKKKYGSTIEEVLAYKVKVDQELELLTNLDRSRTDLEEQLQLLQVRMKADGAQLSSLRLAAAERMTAAMERELQQLAMPSARFSVALEPLAEPRETGSDRVEFLFSPNPGEAPKPLAKIASGGELSRLMLALKQIHPESSVPTLIFDEVDTGISGATSALVGKKLKNVAAGQQVLCITHLPQVAACADQHFLVKKEVVAGRTVTGLGQLDGDGRVAELARLLGGEKVTATSLQHAREMIAHAQLS
jgi:DNA repair protein RecN (Recombination protein N)